MKPVRKGGTVSKFKLIFIIVLLCGSVTLFTKFSQNNDENIETNRDNGLKNVEKIANIPKNPSPKVDEKKLEEEREKLKDIGPPDQVGINDKEVLKDKGPVKARVESCNR
eukprot:TRINITY_DN492_c0_g1_i1.p1 TRINITY_DN492_c0_g1~~TRINITY_DN492_c0_g1_i1.p1  ORF type:complete len:118 (-),score=31.94 TRINITY_DN492_c0_g1_i1:398-727(-)